MWLWQPKPYPFIQLANALEKLGEGFESHDFWDGGEPYRWRIELYKNPVQKLIQKDDVEMI
ncbi:MAG: hypothetical protein C4332_05735 [Meiothermus sp.]